jgi:tryptophan synthase beta chain
MGEVDVKRQALNVFRMEMLGATVVAAKSGQRTLKEAVDEALMDFIQNAQTTFYLLGSAVGPHPYPTMVKYFQSIIGKEAREQHLNRFNQLPNAVVACVGGGSNAIGLFDAFMQDQTVIKYGVEPAGYGLNTNKHAATITKGVEGVIHGFKTLVLQDENSEPSLVHSIAAGLNYPGVGPEHSYFHDAKLAQYVSVTDEETLKAFFLTSRLEGIIPALETSHAIAYAIKLAKTMPKDQTIIVNLSGRGDKDVEQLKEMIENDDTRIAFYKEKDFAF